LTIFKYLKIIEPILTTKSLSGYFRILMS